MLRPFLLRQSAILIGIISFFVNSGGGGGTGLIRALRFIIYLQPRSVVSLGDSNVRTYSKAMKCNVRIKVNLIDLKTKS